jgi:4-aminobutyrate aminotransferase/(S)-3-amino-2-methylpropionate transaminase
MSARLAAVESRNVTYRTDGWPVFWEEARGANVRDADGNVYIDLTGAFGVALLGHGSPEVRAAIDEQTGRLIHGMGDVHPPVAKLLLLERLAALAPWKDARVVLATSGSEAVEAALKTAQLASGRPGILAFDGGYHGLTLGSLAVTRRAHFRAPFSERVYTGVAFAPFPDPLRDAAPDGAGALRRVADLLDGGAPNGDAIGTIVIEPVQARGGARVPPPGFMAALSDLARERDVLIVADEIMTGMGRCGAPFASARVGLDPDLICVGKALGGGLPISACLAPRRVMDAWPPSEGEAIHTSTFLGHPLACATATAVLDALEGDDAYSTAERIGVALVEGLRARLAGVSRVAEVRGLGLLVGVELVSPDGSSPATGLAARVAERALAEGVLVLPAGDAGHVVELTPPLTLTTEQVRHVVDVLSQVIQDA